MMYTMILWPAGALLHRLAFCGFFYIGFQSWLSVKKLIHFILDKRPVDADASGWLPPYF